MRRLLSGITIIYDILYPKQSIKSQPDNVKAMRQRIKEHAIDARNYSDQNHKLSIKVSQK